MNYEWDCKSRSRWQLSDGSCRQQSHCPPVLRVLSVSVVKKALLRNESKRSEADNADSFMTSRTARRPRMRPAGVRECPIDLTRLRHVKCWAGVFPHLAGGERAMSPNVLEAVIAIVAGILVLTVPQLLIWFVGIYLIVVGVVKLTRAQR